MAAPRELSLEAIRIYMLENGGKVTNHDLVKHFKRFLTNPETRDEARNKFKEYVNTLATIRNEDGEKCLVLKKRFRPEAQLPPPPAPASPSISMSSSCSVPSLLSMSSESLASSVATSPPPPPGPGRLPPPYRPPPPPAVSPGGTPPPPTAPPRRRSSDRLLLQEGAAVTTTTTTATAAAAALAAAGQVQADGVKRPKTMGAETPPPSANSSVNSSAAPSLTVSPASPPPQQAQQPPPLQQQAAQAPAQPAQADAAVSVKERTQRFQRLASESDLLRVAAPAPSNALTGRRGAADDDSGDSVSVNTLDVRAREWLVRAAQADHLQLTKLANEDPRLPRLRDPSSGYTALHWGAKHGNEHVIKLIAGTHRADVNARTHGGYTPAHIAMQFNHENIFSLLVEAYGADPNLRDWSGRKPRQYLANQDTAVSADTFRRADADSATRNKSKKETIRERTGISTHWFIEYESEEDNGGIQQLSGSRHNEQ